MIRQEEVYSLENNAFYGIVYQFYWQKKSQKSLKNFDKNDVYI